MEKKRSAYDQKVFDKAESPLAKRLQQLVTNPSELKDYLGCSLQAVNQYKQGTAFPKVENLIKIAEYYGISVDYLLGLTDIPNLDNDLQSIHRITGLSVGAICKLSEFKKNGEFPFINVISTMIEDRNAAYFLALICQYIALTEKEKSELIGIEMNGVKAEFFKENLINTLIQSKIIENLPEIARVYKQQFDDNPAKNIKQIGGN